MTKKRRLKLMASINEATGAMCEFLKRTLSVEDAKVVKIAKIPEGWEGDVEVYEESSFIKSIGLQTKVKDRNYYRVKIDGNLDVQEYQRRNSNHPQE
jgi:hypothetical protein